MRFQFKAIKKIISKSLIVFLLLSFLPTVNVVNAQLGVVSEPVVQGQLTGISGQLSAQFAKEEAAKKADEAKQSVWSKMFGAALSRALSTIAYDTATWLGSGGEGEKPLFMTEGVAQYMQNIGDSVLGESLEILGRDNGWVKFNMCNPDLMLKVRLGFGLYQYSRPQEPACTFSEMRKNWTAELNKPPEQFFTGLQDMFNPTSNDLGMSLTFQTKVMNDYNETRANKLAERSETGGWLDFGNVAQVRNAYPQRFADEAESGNSALVNNLAVYTGNAVVDAANIFVNQLLITLFNTLMRNLTEKDTSQPYTGDWGGFDQFLSSDSSPYNPGAAGAEKKFAQILQKDFSEPGDYDILTKLSMCPDPANAGPTDCVIDGRFRDAIAEKKTLREAVDGDYLNKNFVFGFASQGKEPSNGIQESYPYRSMPILRKYRIIPVGWEVAANRIFADERKAKVTLGDMMACFSSTDDVKGYNDDGAQFWCEGLVDPNWLLKAPKNYCKKEGPGPVARATVM
ncbi:MAG: hypothetical protein ABH881_03685, partial [bacterium]